MSTIIFVVRTAITTLQVILKNNVTIKSQKGVTIIEYAFLSILIAAVVVGSVKTIGEQIATMVATVNTSFH